MGQEATAVMDAPPISTVIGANVFRYRVLRIPKMTQEELAGRAGVALETLRRIEMSRDPAHKQLRPRVDTVEDIAHALGVEFIDLISYDGGTRAYLYGVGPDLEVIAGDAMADDHRDSRQMPLVVNVRGDSLTR